MEQAPDSILTTPETGSLLPWQQAQWQQVQSARNESRLPHAMLLLGNRGLGKAGFARHFAASLLCREDTADGQPCGHCNSCELLRAGTHPDYYWIEPTASKNTTSKKPLTSIRIDEIRELCAQMAHTSQFGGYRVAIINDIHKMTHEAANSLLKTLEEPGSNVVILLITSRASRLPATIRSRCQQLRFNEPATDMAISWLQQQAGQSYTTDQISSALKLAGGAPLAAGEFLAADELRELVQQAMLARANQGSVIEFAAKLVPFDRGQVLGMILHWVSDAIRYRLNAMPGEGAGAGPEASRQQALQSMVANVSLARLYWFYDQLQDQRRLESIAINEQLLWENLLLSWKQL